MKTKIDYSIYLCTDRALMSCETIEQSVEQAILGGATVIQLREKDISSGDFYHMAVRVKAITDKYGVALIINDRADIALAVGCAGVHIGQSDLPCVQARQIMCDKVVGVSVATVEEAIRAVQDGADYLGVGAMFSTNTKTDARHVSRQMLAEIRRAVDVPIVIIGGINKETMCEFKGMGIDGIAVVSAILAKPDIRKAAQEISQLWNKGI